MRKGLVFILALGLMAIAALTACSSSGSTPTQADKCKTEATQVYTSFLKAKSLSEVLVLASPYINDEGTTTKLRHVLPECKPLTEKQDDQIEKQLQPLYTQVQAHIDALTG